MPRFFSGLLHFYRRSKNSQRETLELKTIADKTGRIASLSIDELKHRRVLLQNKIVALDFDIYEFALQRFQKQLLALIAKT